MLHLRKNRYDNIVDKMFTRIERVTDKMAKDFSGTNPFDKEPMSNAEMLQEYNINGYNVFKQIADTKGLSEAIKYRDKMERLKLRSI